jgi:hypothetical protein
LQESANKVNQLIQAKQMHLKKVETEYTKRVNTMQAMMAKEQAAQ